MGNLGFDNILLVKKTHNASSQPLTSNPQLDVDSVTHNLQRLPEITQVEGANGFVYASGWAFGWRFWWCLVMASERIVC